MLATRTATASDAGLIAAHRHAMFAEMRRSDESTLAEMTANFEPWVAGMIAAGKYVGWIVEDSATPVASAGFFELEWQPHPLDPAAQHRGYLLNFWVDPAYRGRGLARSLVRESLAEARRRGIRVVALHASDAGRSVYEAMGFRATNEMFHINGSEP
jgi:ribosomal protein S18 acetylase RimI-like enzyme